MEDKSSIDIVRDFLGALQNEDYEVAFTLTQPTWQTNKTVKHLKQLLSIKVISFERLEVISIAGLDNNIVNDVQVQINFRYRLGKKRESVMCGETRVIRTIKEIGAYRPSKDGTFGVNPISMLRKQQVQ